MLRDAPSVVKLIWWSADRLDNRRAISTSAQFDITDVKKSRKKNKQNNEAIEIKTQMTKWRVSSANAAP